MKKPIKPTKPVPPEEFTNGPIYLEVSNYTELTYIIEKISEILEGETFEVSRLSFNGIDEAYGDTVICCRYFPKEKRKNVYFEQQLKNYERELKNYESNYKKYRADLKAYNDFVKKQKEIKERDDVKAAQKLLKEVGLI